MSTNNNQKLKELYQLLRDNGGDVGASVDEFAQKMQDSTKRQAVYDLIRANGAQVGDFAHFSKGIGIGSSPSIAKPVEQSYVKPERPLVLRPEAQSSASPKSNIVTHTQGLAFGKEAPLGTEFVSPKFDRQTDETGKDRYIPQATLVPSAEHPAIPKKVVKDYVHNKTYDWDSEQGQALVEKSSEVKNKYGDQLEQVGIGQFNIGERLETARKALAERGEQVQAAYGNKWWQNVNRGGGIAGMPHSVATNSGLRTDSEYISLQGAIRALENSQELLNEQYKSQREEGITGFVKGAGRGFKNKLFDVRTWDGGIQDMSEGGALAVALDKYEKGEKLSSAEQYLLDAKATEVAVRAYTANDIGYGYEGGEITAQALPFMLEMFINPASKAGTSIGSRVTRYALKRFAQTGMSKGAKKLATKAVGVTSRIAGDAVGATGMAMTTGLGRVGADATRRMAGDIQHGHDEEGHTAFTGVENREEATDAILKALGSTSIENHSEMVGEYFAPILSVAGKGISKGLSKVGLGGVVETLGKLNKGKWSRAMDRFADKTQWHGVAGEFAEEIVGGIENALIVGDQTLDTDEQTGLFNSDNLIRTAVGVGLMGGVMSAVRTAGYRTEAYEARKDAERAGQVVSRLFSDSSQWSSIREAFEGGDETLLYNAINAPETSSEQRKAMLLYAMAYERYQGVLASNASSPSAPDVADVGGQSSEASVANVADEAEANVAGTDNVADGSVAGGQESVDDADELLGGADGGSAGNAPSVVHQDSGTVVIARVAGRDSRSAITSGNVVRNPDGTIDRDASDNSIVIIDESTGAMEMVSIDDIDEVEGEYSADEWHAAVASGQSSEASGASVAGEVVGSGQSPVVGTESVAGEPVVSNDDIELGAQGMFELLSPEDGQPMRGSVIYRDDDGGWVVHTEMAVQLPGEKSARQAHKISDEELRQLILPGSYRSVDGGESEASVPSVASNPSSDSAPSVADIDNVSGTDNVTGTESVSGEAVGSEQESEASETSGDSDGSNTSGEVSRWQSLLSEADGDEEIAEGVAQSMAEDLRKELKKYDGKLPTAKGKTTAEKMASLREHKARRASLEAELALWEGVLEDAKNSRKARAYAELEAQSAARQGSPDLLEEARAAVEARRQAESEAQEARRQQVEALNGVPEWTDDKPSDARARGYRSKDGERIERQEPVQAEYGDETSVKFGDDAQVEARYALIEVDDLQPSHYEGSANPRFFIDEAQPKARTDANSVMSARKMAEGINPSEITEGTTAYVGSPIVNSRGEVIQGNGRSAGLRYMYSGTNGKTEQSAEAYRQWLSSNASRWGLTEAQVSGMRRPVLVRIADVSDAEAINLGQYNSADTESGGKQAIRALETMRKLGSRAEEFTRRLLTSEDADAGIAELLEENGVETLVWLRQQGLITPEQFLYSVNERQDGLTDAGRTGLKEILQEFLFQGAEQGLRNDFKSLPAVAQQAILATAYRDMQSAMDNRMLTELQDSIRAYALMKSTLKGAKTQEDVFRFVESWKSQPQQFQDGEAVMTPEERYGFSNFAIHLASLYHKGKKVELINLFNDLYDEVQGMGDALFDAEAGREKSLSEAVKRVLNIDYNGKIGSETLAKPHQASPSGERTIDSSDTRGGRAESSSGSAESGGGASGVSVEAGSGQSSVGGETGGRETGGQKPAKGRKQLAKAHERLEGAMAARKSGDANWWREAANALATRDTNISRGAVSTAEEDALAEAVRNALSEEGYELIEMLGKPYHEGMKVVADFVADETLAEGEQVIWGVRAPQVNKDGKMVQAATITVRVGVGRGSASGAGASASSPSSGSSTGGTEALGRGPFGERTETFRDNPQGAATWLQANQGGEAVGVFSHTELGDISLVWGDERGGLLHIIKRHIEEQNDFSSVEDAVVAIEDVVTNGAFSRENADKVVIDYNGYRVVINKQKRGEDGSVISVGNWVVTAFDRSRNKKEKASSGKTLTTPPSNPKADGVTLPSNDTSSSSESKGSEKMAFGGYTREDIKAKADAIARQIEAIERGEYFPEGADDLRAAWDKYQEAKLRQESGSIRSREFFEIEIEWEHMANRYVRPLRATLSSLSLPLFDDYASWRAQHGAELAESPQKGAGVDGTVWGMVGKDPKRTLFHGVHHQGGYAVGSDGAILLADKTAYDKSHEGKTVAPKTGAYIDGGYPDWKAVIPDGTATTAAIDTSKLSGQLRTARAAALSLHKGVTPASKRADLVGMSPVGLLLSDGRIVYYPLRALERLSSSGERLSFDRISVYGDGRLLSKSEQGIFMSMPLNMSSVTDDIVGYVDLSGGGHREFQVEQSERSRRESEGGKLATEAVLEALSGAGIDVVRASDAEVEAVLGGLSAGAELSRGQKRALDTASPAMQGHLTVVSSTPGAKVLKDLDSAIAEYENKSSNPRTFIGDLARALGASRHGSLSQYATFETIGGKVVTIRLSNHNAKVSNFDNAGEEHGISIVVTGKPNRQMTDDGWAHVEEYFYQEQTLKRAEGKPLVEILKGIKQALYSGEYKDTTGLAEYQEVNGGRAEMHMVWHGSPHSFSAFDHSHMGSGEGAQAFGWGTYVTEVEGIARSYAVGNSYMPPATRSIIESSKRQLQMAEEEFRSAEAELKALRQYAKSPKTLERHLEQALKAKNYSQERVDFLRSAQEGDLEDKIVSAERAVSYSSERIAKIKSYIVEQSSGRHLYTVEIPDTTSDNYLDLEARPDTGVVEKVLSYFAQNHPEFNVRLNGATLTWELDGISYSGNVARGEQLYNTIARIFGHGEKEASLLLSAVGLKGIRYPANYLSGGRADGARNYVIFREEDAKIVEHVQFMRTPRGVVYGWTEGGKIYLTEAGMQAETPIHEYTHIWAHAMQRSNPEGWQSIKDLLRDTPVWAEVLSDPNYQHLSGNEDAVASEVLSRISGRENSAKMEAEAERAIREAGGVLDKASAGSVLSRMREALKKFWSWVGKSLFDIKRFGSIDEVTDRVLYDLVHGTELGGGKQAQMVSVSSETDSKLKVSSLPLDTELPVVQIEGGDVSYAEAKASVESLPSSVKSGDGIELNVSRQTKKKLLNELRKTRSTDYYAAVSELEQVVGASVLLEEHRDRKKVSDVRVSSNPSDGNIDKVQRFYGALRINEKLYRVKTTAVVYKQSISDSRLHTYDITKIELLQPVPTANSQATRQSNSSIPLAKLVENVELSYEGGKLLSEAMAEARQGGAEMRIEGESDIRYRRGSKEVERSHIDEEYLSAIERGDMEEAERLVHAYAKSMGYSPSEDYQDAHVAPVAQIDAEDFTNLEALEGLNDDGYDINLYGIAHGIQNVPDDYFSPLGAKRYMYDTREGRESYANLMPVIRSIQSQMREYGEVINIPKIVVYRAVPNEVKEGALQSGGQWVSPSRSYAEAHGASRFGEGAFRIIEEEVSAENLWWDNNDINEWGFDDGKTYGYKNTKHSRKLYDAVTYDDQGRIIPLSQRFDEQQSDVRYRRESGSSASETSGTSSDSETRSGGQSSVARRREAMAERAEALGRELGVSVRVVRDRGALPRHQQGVLGWFDPRSGEVVVVLDNHRSVSEVEATVYHEVVGHKGLRELVGEDVFEGWLHEVYTLLPEGVRGKIAMDVSTGRVGSLSEGIEEYLAEFAERGFDEERSLWRKLVDKVRELVRKYINSKLEMTENDIRYQLWKAYHLRKASGQSSEASGTSVTSSPSVSRGASGQWTLARVLAEAEDIAKRTELGVGGRYRSAYGTLEGADKERWIAERAFDGHYLRSGSGKPNRSFRDKFGDMSVEAAREQYVQEHIAYMREQRRLRNKIVAFERYLNEQGVDRIQSNKSESRYYYYKGYKYRFSDHIYPTGSMTSDQMNVIDFAADPHLIDRVDFPYSGLEEGAPRYLDKQGNAVDKTGKLITERIGSIEELRDEDFTAPSRSVELPSLPIVVAEALGTEGKPVVIKRNIFEKNHKRHSDLSPADSRAILETALYRADLYGQNKKTSRPYNWILIHLADKNTAVVLEVSRDKDNVEIVNWHYLSGETLAQKERQAIDEGGRILTLSSAAGNTIDNSSTESKGSEKMDDDGIRYRRGNARKAAQRYLREELGYGNGIRISDNEILLPIYLVDVHYGDDPNSGYSTMSTLRLEEVESIMDEPVSWDEVPPGESITRAIKIVGYEAYEMDSDGNLGGYLGDLNPEYIRSGVSSGLLDLARERLPKELLALEDDILESRTYKPSLWSRFKSRWQSGASVPSSDSSTSVAGGQSSEDSGQWSEDSEQSSEDSGQWSEDSEQSSEDSGQWSVVRGSEGSAKAEYEHKTRGFGDERQGALSKNPLEAWRAYRVNARARAYEGHFDYMYTAKLLMEAVLGESGQSLEDWEDFYTAENHLSSRNQGELSIYQRDYLKPMYEAVAKLGKAGASYESIQRYMIAKHGLERNERMSRDKAELAAQKRGKDWDGSYELEDHSGLTELTGSEDNFTEGAKLIVSDFESLYDVDALWSSVRKATRESLRKGVESNTISRAYYDELLDMYEYYIPLRGWQDGNVAGEMWNYYYSSPGKQGNVLVKKTGGRKSLADDPLAVIAFMGEQAIRQGNRNIMKMKFLNFARNHRTSLLNVSRVWYVRGANGEWHRAEPELHSEMTDAERMETLQRFEEDMKALRKEGNATTRRPKGVAPVGTVDAHITQGELREHAVYVLQGGEEYVVYVNGNPRAAQAINGLLNEGANHWANNWLSQMATSKNPAFIIKNLVMDSISASTAMFIKEDARYLKDFRSVARHIVDNARRISRFEQGTLDMDNELDRYFDEFVRHGGETGHTELHKVEDYKRELERFVRDYVDPKTGIVRAPAAGFRMLGATVEGLNRAAEVNTRFSTYVASRRAGRSIQRSVHDAKEISVNFNRKGSGTYGGGAARFAYTFYNAGMQALRRLYELQSLNPKRFWGVASGYASLGFVVPALNLLAMALLGGDDEEEHYWALNEYTRRSNILIYTGGGKFAKIPLPHELRTVYGLGENLLSLVLGRQDAVKTAVSGLGGFADLLPVDPSGGNGGNPTISLASSYLQPILQWFNNVNYFGQEIYKDTDANKDDPNWTKATHRTNKGFVEADKFLHELTGGDDYKRGWSNSFFNGAIVEHLLEGYTSGTGKFVNQTVKSLMSIAQGEMPEARDVPIVSTFRTNSSYGRPGRLSPQYWEMRGAFKETEDLWKSYSRDASNVVDASRAERYKRKLEELQASPEYQLWVERGAAVQELYQLYKARKTAVDDATRDAIDKRMRELERGTVRTGGRFSDWSVASGQ